MNTRDLQIFIKIADYNSITRAAEDVQMTQPAVSSILKRLEEELGYALFSRRGKWLIMNAQGELFYRAARKFLEEFSHVQEGLYLENYPQEEIVIQICRNSDKLYSLLGRFSMANPTIRLILQRGKASQQENYRKADFTISLEKEHNPRKQFYPLEHCAALYALIQKKNPLSSRHWLRLEDLKQESFVFLKNKDDSIPERVYQACIQLNFHPKVSVFTDSIINKYLAIRCGCGVGLSFDNEVSFAPRCSDWAVIPVMEPLSVEWVGLSWFEDKLSPAGRKLLTFIKEEA
ncbi:LysR family transcriptional regulator [Oribacterium sp. HCP28S3_H8]|uniref:LysR family transcriptional regulator n=1 Tax=Oribacterium sp. HCP28S3_H8 TaxID=3438945 RepID=UPI003F898C8D